MNTETPKQAASYGEPYHIEHGNQIHDRDGYWIADAKDSEWAERLTECVNACAGIADPEKAIQAAREALAEIVKPLGDETESSGNPCISPSPAQGRKLAAALAQLNHT